MLCGTFPALKPKLCLFWNFGIKTDHDSSLTCRVTSFWLTNWTYVTCTLFDLNQSDLNLSYYFLFMNVNMADNCMLNFWPLLHVYIIHVSTCNYILNVFVFHPYIVNCVCFMLTFDKWTFYLYGYLENICIVLVFIVLYTIWLIMFWFMVIQALGRSLSVNVGDDNTQAARPFPLFLLWT